MTDFRCDDVIEATFRPTRADDLIHGTRSMIGGRFHWQAQYTISHGVYKGQLAWMLWPEDTSNDADYHQPCVPTCDLADVEVVELAPRADEDRRRAMIAKRRFQAITAGTGGEWHVVTRLSSHTHTLRTGLQEWQADRLVAELEKACDLDFVADAHPSCYGSALLPLRFLTDPGGSPCP